MRSFSKTPARLGRGIKKFFTETFRARGKRDYEEFFTRGLNGKKGKNNIYPWMWARLFALGLCAFAAVTSISAVTGNAIAYPVCVLLGGAFANLAVITLVYELCPERDLSFVAAAFTLFIGAIACNVIILGLYKLIPAPANPWAGTVRVALTEEFAKAFVAVCAIITVGKRNPRYAFVLAAAVGAGMSAAEDAGYIFKLSYGMLSAVYPRLISTAASRALTSVCTHTLWTGFVGWAFCKFRKPFINIKFWAVALAAVAFHFLWDMPLGKLGVALTQTCCGIICIAFAVCIIASERRAVIVSGEDGTEPADRAETCTEAALSCQSPRNMFDFGDIVMCVCACILSVFVLIACYFGWGWRSNREYVFSSANEFLAFVDTDGAGEADFGREYDPYAGNYSESFNGGKLVSAVQKVEAGEGTYYYYYSFDYGGEGSAAAELTGISFTTEEGIYLSKRIETADGVINYFVCNPYVYDTYYDVETGEFGALVHERWFKGMTESIALGACAGAVFLCGVVGGAALKIKSRRNKNA